jgi:hypothetical protein
MTASVAIGPLVEGVWLALTPLERWSAVRTFSKSSSGPWLIIVCIALLVVLAALLWWVSVKRVKRERKSTERSFGEYARQRGLSDRELQLLTIIAHKAGLKRPESVFTMGPAFGLGAARVMEEGIEGEHDAEQREQLRMELSFLREKLGFGKRLSSSEESSDGLRKVTTRQIPVGKKLYVIRRKTRGNADIESTVVRNNDSELAVTLSAAIQIVSGASVWEFDTSVLSYDGNTLVLNHSDSVRFVNRRRFLRVSVNFAAFVARFPFMRTFESAVADRGDFQSESSGQTCATPRFVPAVVTEMAGPGLRIESALEVEVGERILVVFGLDGQGGKESSGGGGDHGKSRPVVLEGIGEVRHVKAVEDGLSIAVELTGLNDSEVDELIRATNAACLLESDKHEDSPVPVGQGV